MKTARAIFYAIRTHERRLVQALRANPKSWLHYILHAEMLAFVDKKVAQGMAIGMFWGFVPMPFQMAPATFFCWLTRANLPVALVCVWISNPFTYVPIFYVEYQVGVALFGGEDITWDDFRQLTKNGEHVWDLLRNLGVPLFKGAMVVSIVLSILGYFAGLGMFRFINKNGNNASSR